jgi:hypothetical protein
MTSADYKATPEQWAHQEAWVNQNGANTACILELRARVQALEEAENNRRFEQAKAIIDKPAPAPADSLMERVARLLAEKDDPHEMWRIDARAAIRDEQAENLAYELEIIGGCAEDEGGLYVCVSDLGLLARAVLARWGRPTIQPIPVAERPWEREEWCNEGGWCWGFDADDTDPCWIFDKPETCICWTHCLPAHALPIPTSQED